MHLLVVLLGLRHPLAVTVGNHHYHGMVFADDVHGLADLIWLGGAVGTESQEYGIAQRTGILHLLKDLDTHRVVAGFLGIDINAREPLAEGITSRQHHRITDRGNVRSPGPP